MALSQRLSPNGSLPMALSQRKVHLANAPCIVRHAPRRSYRGHTSHVAGLTFLKDDHRLVSCGGRDKALFQFRVVPAPAQAGEPTLMREGAAGTLQTTAFGGGFGDTSGAAAAAGGGGGEEEEGEGVLRRWGESVVLPHKGITRPAWTHVRYTGACGAGGEVGAGAGATGGAGRRGGLGAGGGAAAATAGRSTARGSTMGSTTAPRGSTITAWRNP